MGEHENLYREHCLEFFYKNFTGIGQWAVGPIPTMGTFDRSNFFAQGMNQFMKSTPGPGMLYVVVKSK